MHNYALMFRPSRLLLFAFFFTSLTLSAHAETWTTTDGKTYQDVKVIKTEDDAVTILDADGGALVPLGTLSPELQQRFHYDPEKAKIAAAHRQSEARVTQQEVEGEKQAAAQLKAPSATPLSAPPSAPAPLVAAATPPSSAESTSTPSLAQSSLPAPGGSQFSLNKGDAGTADASHAGVNPNWKLVWSDEFDGDAIDTSKWAFEIDGKGGGNGEMEYYTDKPENAHLDNGNLVITASKDGRDAEGQKHEFTSARMVTKNKFSWKYGRFEARIKMPTGRGVWPAFWLMPQDATYGGWARSGEIDIVEEVGDKPDTAFGTIHYGDKWPGNVHTGDKYVLPSGILADDFHVYAVEWEPGEIRWYIDGKLYQTQTKWYTNAAPFPAPFDQKFFLILNFAVGGAWPGRPSPDTVFPQSMTVDYVRVYQAPDMQ
jgi:beta-glucanase (GH16 family)